MAASWCNGWVAQAVLHAACLLVAFGSARNLAQGTVLARGGRGGRGAAPDPNCTHGCKDSNACRGFATEHTCRLQEPRCNWVTISLNGWAGDPVYLEQCTSTKAPGVVNATPDNGIGNGTAAPEFGRTAASTSRTTAAAAAATTGGVRWPDVIEPPFACSGVRPGFVQIPLQATCPAASSAVTDEAGCRKLALSHGMPFLAVNSTYFPRRACVGSCLGPNTRGPGFWRFNELAPGAEAHTNFVPSHSVNFGKICMLPVRAPTAAPRPTTISATTLATQTPSRTQRDQARESSSTPTARGPQDRHLAGVTARRAAPTSTRPAGKGTTTTTTTTTSTTRPAGTAHARDTGRATHVPTTTTARTTTTTTTTTARTTATRTATTATTGAGAGADAPEVGIGRAVDVGLIVSAVLFVCACAIAGTHFQTKQRGAGSCSSASVATTVRMGVQFERLPPPSVLDVGCDVGAVVHGPPGSIEFIEGTAVKSRASPNDWPCADAHGGSIAMQTVASWGNGGVGHDMERGLGPSPHAAHSIRSTSFGAPANVPDVMLMREENVGMETPRTPYAPGFANMVDLADIFGPDLAEMPRRPTHGAGSGMALAHRVGTGAGHTPGALALSPPMQTGHPLPNMVTDTGINDAVELSGLLGEQERFPHQPGLHHSDDAIHAYEQAGNALGLPAASMSPRQHRTQHPQHQHQHPRNTVPVETR